MVGDMTCCDSTRCRGAVVSILVCGTTGKAFDHNNALEESVSVLSRGRLLDPEYTT